MQHSAAFGGPCAGLTLLAAFVAVLFSTAVVHKRQDWLVYVLPCIHVKARVVYYPQRIIAQRLLLIIFYLFLVFSG